jgi:hypothetical protein
MLSRIEDRDGLRICSEEWKVTMGIWSIDSDPSYKIPIMEVL